ncbi:MAG TPA: tetratricopeptide repeat protein [Bryobacteraceae bacterium]|nr:tetratricopeptide repeat protein [Bryobacteraceae bacterium]
MRYLFVLFAFTASIALADDLRFASSPKATMSTDDQIEIYQRWAKADPANIQTQTLLAAAYIQKTRETADPGYLERSDALVHRVLEKQPKNYEAWRLRNIIELTRHHFAVAADYSRQLTTWLPSDPQNWGTLGDALMELGKYDDASKAYNQMAAIKSNLFSLNRLAYYKFVTGDAPGALITMGQAVEASAPYPENKAWCLADLGSMYFKSGKLDDAERSYREAIAAFPGQHQAHAGLGAVLAARGKNPEAIESYLKAQAIVPLPQYAGALSDLYRTEGNTAEAKKQDANVDMIARLEEAVGQKANRTLALIYANQGRNLERAQSLAEADLELRHDIYTWDAFSWVQFKRGHMEEARKASQEALKTGAKEPLLLYHAGIIENSAGNPEAARKLLESALALNPRFDLVQAANARKTLAEMPAQH